MSTNKFRVRFNEKTGKPEVQTVARASPKKSVASFSGNIVRTESGSVRFESDQFSQFNEWRRNFTRTILSMGLKHDHTTKIFNEFTTMINLVNGTSIKSIENCKAFPEKSAVINILNEVNGFVISELSKYGSTHKRRKEISQEPTFVAPKEKAIGTKWKSTRKCNSDLPDHVIQNAKFQYVSIEETIKAQFEQPAFRDAYFNYNNFDKHECKDGTYQNFCCGSIHKNIEALKERDTIQIQIAIDDFEVCNPLKSKTKIHKLSGIYFQIRNMPAAFLSKLNNIFLIALCETTNFKSDEAQSSACFDEIAKLIVLEMKRLETAGIDICGKRLKVVLINISFDNLGGNEVLGLSKSFNANFYCRICECSKQECQQLVHEDRDKLRRKSTYERALLNAESQTQSKKDLTASKGIKKACAFTELISFHPFVNLSVDPMHDLCEGILPFFIHQFIEFSVKNRIMTKEQINGKIRDFDYGLLNSKNKPTAPNFESAKLGYSASQLYCVAIHMPFIFMEYQNKLKDIWPIMISLLQSLQIVFSSTINERDILRLEKKIASHLAALIDILEVHLLPKHHIFTHYPTIIRLMGPVILMWQTQSIY